MEPKKLTSRSSIKIAMMIVSIIVVLILVPLVFMYGHKFEEFLKTSGVIISPNYDDGYLIAEFVDPKGDVRLPLPQDLMEHDVRNALDIRKFSIKKVKFNTLSGMGLEARLNLCFEFDEKQPNPFEFKNKFSFPVIHVYVKTPGDSIIPINSLKTAKVNFEKEGWKYQIIIDGMHEQSRVYDNNGKFLFDGIGLYVHYEYEKGRQGNENIIAKTRITAGLPLTMMGDPASGVWKYYVVVGLLDVKRPSMLYAAGQDSSDVFDCVVPDTLHRYEPDATGFLSLSPLLVNYSNNPI